jgi:hypothetical protein
MRSVGMYPRPVWTRRAAMRSAIVYRLTISRSLLEYSQGRRTDHTALKSGGICRQYDDMARFLCDWVAALACEMATRRPQRKAWSQFCLPVGQLRLKTEAKTMYVSTREAISLVGIVQHYAVFVILFPDAARRDVRQSATTGSKRNIVSFWRGVFRLCGAAGLKASVLAADCTSAGSESGSACVSETRRGELGVCSRCDRVSIE